MRRATAGRIIGFSALLVAGVLGKDCGRSVFQVQPNRTAVIRR
jgi:hypothetical protein